MESIISIATAYARAENPRDALASQEKLEKSLRLLLTEIDAYAAMVWKARSDEATAAKLMAARENIARHIGANQD